MNKELREAANEYHCRTHNELKEDRRQTSTGAFWFGEDVIRAFIAGANWHPADEDEPVTPEYIRSIGNPERDDKVCVIVFLTPTSAPVFVRAIWEFAVPPVTHEDRAVISVGNKGNSVFIPIPVATRGHVRRLCAALGIALKEPQ